jgi:hypothetical protein
MLWLPYNGCHISAGCHAMVAVLGCHAMVAMSVRVAMQWLPYCGCHIESMVAMPVAMSSDGRHIESMVAMLLDALRCSTVLGDRLNDYEIQVALAMTNRCDGVAME